MQGIFLKLIFCILKNHMIFIMSYYFYKKEQKLKKIENVVGNLHDKADVETRFDTSNYELGRPLPKGRNEKSNWINERWIRRITKQKS